jgi:rod shape-determining protein MreD
MFASFVQGPLVRLIPVGIILLALQRTLFVELRPADVVIQVVLAFAAACGAAAGPEKGALAGFIVGLLYDLGVGTPLGSSSVTMGLAGFAAGYVMSITVDPQWWLAALFVAVGAAVGEIAVPVVRTFIGEVGAVDERLMTIVPIVAVAAALMSPLMVPVGRWCLRIKRPEWKAPPA